MSGDIFLSTVARFEMWRSTHYSTYTMMVNQFINIIEDNDLEDIANTYYTDQPKQFFIDVLRAIGEYNGE